MKRGRTLDEEIKKKNKCNKKMKIREGTKTECKVGRQGKKVRKYSKKLRKESF